MSRAPIISGIEVVAEAEQDRHADEEHHRRAVHGEELVEDLRRNKMIIGNGKLNPHQHRFEARNDEKDQGVYDIHQPDLLVVDRRQPLVHHIKRWPSLEPPVVSIDGFEYRSCIGHAALLSA